MKVVIVVPTPDARRPLTLRCLSSLEATTEGTDTLVEVVESSGPRFRFSRSVNTGIRRHPDADAWILLNDDTVMQPGWLQAMLAAAQPGVGVVGAVLHYPDGRLQHAGGFLTGRLGYALHCALRDRAPFHAIRKLRRTPRTAAPFAYHHREAKPGNRLDFVTGACFLVTKECMAAVGGFDEDYEFSFEDIDYCLRAREAGLKIVLAADAHGIHDERATGRGLKAEVIRSEATFGLKFPIGRLAATPR